MANTSYMSRVEPSSLQSRQAYRGLWLFLKTRQRVNMQKCLPKTAAIVFFLSFHLYGQSKKSAQQPPKPLQVEPQKDGVLTHPEFFRGQVRIEMVNDYLPFLNLGSDDHGYTFGGFMVGRIPQRNKNRYLEVTISSQLYTRQAGPRYKDANGYDIDPQHFTEISFISLSRQRYYPKSKIFFCSEVGIGVYNQKKAIPGLALFLQGGQDGKGGFHALFGQQQSRQDNIPTGNIRPNFYSELSIKKIFLLGRGAHPDKAYIGLEPGGQLVLPILEGSRFFVNLFSSAPIVRKTEKQKIKFRLALLGKVALSVHNDGALVVPEAGLAVDLFFLRIGYTNQFIIGRQQDDYIRYSDPDPLMRLYVQVNF